MKAPYLLTAAILVSVPVVATSDELILDDLIIQKSLCVGVDCVVDADFGFDTLVLKSANPRLVFQDTSSSASFPTQEWVIGITDGGSAMPSSFFIKNLTDNLDALVISADGDVALGAGDAVFG